MNDPRRMPPYWRRRLVALAVLLTAGAVGLAVYVHSHLRPGDVFHPHVAFQPNAAPQSKIARAAVPWPLYGYSRDHARFYPAPPTLHPPFHRIWTSYGNALLEFPPVIDSNTLYQLNDSAIIHATAAETGQLRWERRVGSRSASTPAVGGQTLYMTVLAGNTGGGRVLALRQKNGQPRWARSLASPSESSPLLDRGRIYFGSQDGTVYALNAHTGAPLWTYHAGGSVKASPTFADGKLFFGDYGGHMQAIFEADGRRVWVTGGKGLLGGGNFYSTAAVAFGRVYAGSTDGRVYAFDTRSGRLAWAKQTGAYVYSSPAAAAPYGLGPTIYVGSYDGIFYALDAFSGAVRWSFNAHGRISGSPTILGKTVYFADLGTHNTYGLDTRTGRVVFWRDTGSFDPVVTDGIRLYLTGLTGLFAFVPTSGTPRHPRPTAPGARPRPTVTPPSPATMRAGRALVGRLCRDPLLPSNAPLC